MLPAMRNRAIANIFRSSIRNHFKGFACCLAIVFATIGINFETAAQSPQERDASHHAAQKKSGEEHTYKGDRTIRRYATTKKDLQKFQKSPQGKHVTTQAKGRLPGPVAAKKTFGLEKKPKYAFTGKAKNLKVQGKGHDKPTGGKRNATEARVAQKKVDWQSAKITKLKDSKKKK